MVHEAGSQAMANCERSTWRLRVGVVVLAIVGMALLQGALHEFFMRLPMLQYHLVSAAFNAAVVAVTALLYLEWRCTAVTAQDALQQLRASEGLRDDLTSMLVHDLKNPLTSSLIASKMLLHKSRDLADQDRGMLELAVRGQTRVVGMIEDLLDVARAEEGKMPVSMGDTDLTAIIGDVVSEAAPSAEQAGVHLTAQLDACPKVPGDAEKLRRVVSNLVGNAIKFTPQDGTVTVALRCAGPDAVVSVSDTGRGFPAEAQDRIFDKFTQAAADGPRLSVGLGLTFCKLAIEAQGGRIWAESTPGAGSTFSFALPLANTGRAAE